jgi:N-acetylmuramoyl-L-alanine amidase
MIFQRHIRAGRILALSVFLLVTGVAARADDIRVFIVDKKNYVLLRDLALLYGATVSGPVEHQVALISKWNRLTFTTDGREVHVNGTSLWLHEPMTAIRGHWAIREADARAVIDPLIRPLRYLQTGGYRTIVIDPGHGGQDTGAQGNNGVQEKMMAFDIARRLRTQLTKAGFQVYLTRDGDRFIELEQRAERAKRWGADLFVSIHLNSAGSEANGTETYSMTAAGFQSTSGGHSEGADIGNRFDALNSELAYQIQRATTSQAQTADRGVKKARFVVLKHAPCPAVLVETGFVSNRREEIRFMSDKFRDDLAMGIARGVYNYVQLVRMARHELQPQSAPAAAAPPSAPAAQLPPAPTPAPPAEPPKPVTILPTHPEPPR